MVAASFVGEAWSVFFCFFFKPQRWNQSLSQLPRQQDEPATESLALCDYGVRLTGQQITAVIPIPIPLFCFVAMNSSEKET